MGRGTFLIAAKAVIINNKGQMLLLKRSELEIAKSHDAFKTPWDLPGGSVKINEKVIEALNREIYEETNLNVFVLKPFSVFDSIRDNFHISIINYVCKYKGGFIKLSREHDLFKWMTQEEIINHYEIPLWLKNTIKKAFVEYSKEEKLDI